MTKTQIMRSARMSWKEIAKWHLHKVFGLIPDWGAYASPTRRVYEWCSSGVYRRWNSLEDAGFWNDDTPPTGA